MSLLTLVLTDAGIASLALGGISGATAAYKTWIKPHFDGGDAPSKDWEFETEKPLTTVKEVVAKHTDPMSVAALKRDGSELLREVSLGKRGEAVNVVSLLSTIKAKVQVINEVAPADSPRRAETQRILKDLTLVVSKWNDEHRTLLPALAPQIAMLVSGIADEIDFNYQGALMDAQKSAVVEFGPLAQKYAVNDLDVPHDKPFADPQVMSADEVLTDVQSEKPAPSGVPCSTCGKASVMAGKKRYCLTCGALEKNCSCEDSTILIESSMDGEYTTLSGNTVILPKSARGASKTVDLIESDMSLIAHSDVVKVVKNVVVKRSEGKIFLADGSFIGELKGGTIENFDGGSVRVFTEGTIRNARGVHFGYIGPDAVIEDAVDCKFADTSPRAKIGRREDYSRTAKWPNENDFRANKG